MQVRVAGGELGGHQVLELAAREAGQAGHQRLAPCRHEQRGVGGGRRALVSGAHDGRKTHRHRAVREVVVVVVVVVVMLMRWWRWWWRWWWRRWWRWRWERQRRWRGRVDADRAAEADEFGGGVSVLTRRHHSRGHGLNDVVTRQQRAA